MHIVLSSVHGWPAVRRGGERYVHELGAALQRAGHRVAIVTTGAPGSDRVLDVPVRRLPVRPWRQNRHGDLATEVGFGWQCLPRALTTRADVWHATSTGDGAAAATAGRIRPSVTTVFTDHGFPAAASRGKRTDHRYHQRIVSDIDHYVCVSRAAGSWLERDFGRKPDIVPPGVTIADYVPGAREPRPTLLYAGSLDEQRKNVPLLLRAISLLLSRVPDLQLWLYGPGDIDGCLTDVSPAVRAAVTDARLLPPDELPARYARSWVTVLPSHAESFGMVVVESLASGTPAVVLAESGGPAEIVTEDTGVCSAATPEALADACEAALELATRTATVGACRSRAEAYDWDTAVVPRLERIYGA